MDRNSQSLGICQRLINLILGVTSPARPPRPGSARVLIEDGPKDWTGPTSRSNGYLGSEIVVEFRHKDIGSAGRWIDVSNGNSKNEGSVLGSNAKRRPLLSMASDINKKSDKYIERRKKAMSRNYSFDSENS